jgi:catechol 2,3-dioxygenase-like lactoylglutathione lyase family enzyme
MQLATLMVFVTDLDEARRFYGEVLGFPLKRATDEMLVFEHAGADLVAFACEHPADFDDYATAARSAFVFRVASLERSMAKLRARGVRFLHEAPAEGPLGRYAAFVDPCGNVHEICEEPACESQ